MRIFFLVLGLILIVVIGYWLWYSGIVQDEMGVDGVAKETSQQQSGSSDKVNAVTDVSNCDYDTMSVTVKSLIAKVEFDPLRWTLKESTSTPQTYMFGWSESGPITPCSHSITYESKKEGEYVQDFRDDLGNILLTDGWLIEPGFKFTSESTGESVVVGLAHAGGPLGEEIIYVKPNYDQRTVEFARVHVRNNFENRLAYMEGRADNMCPCWGEVTLEMSDPVTFEQLTGAN